MRYEDEEDNDNDDGDNDNDDDNDDDKTFFHCVITRQLTSAICENFVKFLGEMSM